jgi:glutamyl endopeptidase
MPVPGHVPITNTDPTLGPKHNRDRNEAAVLPEINRKTLPYYRPPQPRREINEAAVLNEAAGTAEAMGPLFDVAVASFANTTVLEVVFGNDDRVRVDAGFMRTNPWRQICALRIKSKTGKLFAGTGWFIAPKAVATAGHCVFLQAEGGWPDSIDVIPAKFGPNEPFGRMTSRHYGSVDGWVESQKRDFDYGVIFVDDPEVGKKVGNFEVQSLGDGDLKGAEAKISGYPADRDRAEFQYYHERPLISTTATQLLYEIDTFGGQSGSPIWRDTQESGVVVVGIHTTGGATSNFGTRITDPVIDNLASWANK